LLDRVMMLGGLVFKMQTSPRPDDGVDSLFDPAPGTHAVHGEYGNLTLPGNGYARTFEFHPERQRLLAAGLLLALAAVIRRIGR
jgi:hypothetical protein